MSCRDPTSGQPVKYEFGPWIFPILQLLAKFKFLRGTIFDLFGYTAERRAERNLIHDYEKTLTIVVNKLSPDNHELALQILELPQKIHGFGHIKERKIKEVMKQQALLLNEYQKNS